MKRAGRTAVAVGILLLVLFAGLAGNDVVREARASSEIVDTSTSVTVTATSTFGFTPNVINGVPESVSISLKFINGDTNGGIHTFTILGCANVSIPSTDTPQQFINGTGSTCALPPLANIVPAAKSSLTRSFTAPSKPGWYEFVCTESGHFAAGMYGFIAFNTTVPAYLVPSSSAPGPGLAVFIIVGTIVTLTVIAIVAGFVVGRREGAKHEMPPERLGYAEPGAPPAGKPPTSPPTA